MNINNINLKDYDYDLPSGRIAQYPAVERDISQILVNKDNTITRDIFRNLGNYLPSDSLLIFNNTRVIRARILFRKETGALIEILCLEPLAPVEYELSLSSREPVEWKCLVGNLKKWKSGTIKKSFLFNGLNYNLTAKKVQQLGESWRILFEWGFSGISFGDVIDSTGHIPLPPYLIREEMPEDLNRYQTVYSSIKGSVAAPTAGLHFTESMLKRLKEKGIKTAEVTLHVGAGTFQPIKTKTIGEHEMHCEHFYVTTETIKKLQENKDKIIAVGTTSVRTLESLYWLGIKINKDPLILRDELSLGQWEAYDTEPNVSVKVSMEYLLNYLQAHNISVIHASTSIMIIPGYKFRVINGMITNFHQPRSTLLLLISAWAGKNWKEIYEYALDKDFRFLSYGDCSLLFR